MADPDFSRWIYTPTKGVSIAFAVLFAISGILHLWQNVLRFKSWRIGFLLPWSAALFVAGFILREVGCYHLHDLAIYIGSTVLLFCATPLYAGADYFIFGRVLYYIPYLSPLHPGRVWTTFFSLDVIVEALAGAGASIAADADNTPSKINVGVGMARASLLLQICLFCAFVVLIVIFHLRCLRAGLFTHKIKIVIYELYASSCFILLRSAYRTATFFLSYTAYANRTEWPFWVFEVLPMIANTFMLNIWPPATYMPANHKIYLAKDGKTDLEGSGKIDNRHFLVTLFDPFDVYGIFSGRENTYKYWDEDGIGGPARAEPADDAGSVETEKLASV